MQNLRDWISNNRNKFISILGLVTLLITLPVSFYLVQQRQQIDTEAKWEGFWEGLLICAFHVPGWCDTEAILDTRNYTIDSTIQISGKIYRDSGDGQLNEDIGLFINDQEIFSSYDIPGLPSQHIENFGPIETTIPAGTQSIAARHLDTSAKPSSPGSIGIDIKITVLDFTLQCNDIKLYDENDIPITINDVFIGQDIKIAVSGITADPDGITKARFSFDAGANWTESTNKNGNDEYFIDYNVTDNNTVNIEAQVFNPNLGWK